MPVTFSAAERLEILIAINRFWSCTNYWKTEQHCSQQKQVIS